MRDKDKQEQERKARASGAAAFVSGLAPAGAAQPRVLVLGSMPGVASLRAQRYYAHPRNAFWRIAGDCLGFDAGLSYEARLAALASAGVALWDVLAACERPGSLDSAIDRATARPNDFEAFFATRPGIVRLCFNGAAAADLYERRVLPSLPARPGEETAHFRLPSTSPAHAAMSYSDKLAAWRQGLLGGGEAA